MLKTILTLSASLILAAAPAHGQGFGIYEQGACVMSRGGTGVADPCDDGSAIYVNPAGLTGRNHIVFGTGGTVIFGSGSFTSDAGLKTDMERTLAFSPHGYFEHGINDKVTIGAGVYVPYGLGVKWPIEFAGRFVSYDSMLTTWYVQPTAAYAINESLSVGAGLTVAIGSVTLNRREDLARVPLASVPGLTFGALVDNQTDFLNTKLSASGATGIGANLGVLVKATDRLSFGARYLSSVKLAYDGDAVFTPIVASYRVTKANVLGLPVGTPLDPTVSQVQQAFQNQMVHTELTMPAQFVVGLSAHASEKLKILADYQWVGWSAFDTVTIDFSNPIPPDEPLVQNYRDTSAIRLGTEFLAAPTLRVSAGYFSNQAAAPDENVTPLLPEAQRHHITAGVGWDVRPKFTLDLAYQFIHHADRRGRVVNPAPGELPTTALNSGVYRSRGNLMGITATYRP